MRSPRSRVLPWLLAAALPAAVPFAAGAADQAVLGRKLVVADPKPADASRRKLSLSARDRDPGLSVSGDPTAFPSSGGGQLTIHLEGASPSTQTFPLPDGEASAWRALGGDGFAYRDRKGEFGPVQALKLRRSRSGTMKLVAKLRGRFAPLELVPPDPGSGGWATLQLGDGDRYCVDFGSGVVRDGGAAKFSVKRPETAGCPLQQSGELLALAYNVAGLPEGISGSNPEVNTPLIAPLLNAYDLVLLQETWKTPEDNPLAPLRVYHEILEAGSLHPFRSVAAPLPFGSDPSRPSALVADGLNRFARFPFEAVTRVPWADCHLSAADCLALKGFSFARTSLAPGVAVDVYNLHMEAGGDPEDDLLRDAGVTQLSDFIQANSAGRAVIVGGDFNLHTDVEPDASQYARLLSETGLSDVCEALACPDPSRIDKFAFRSGDDVGLAPLSWRFETDVFVRGDGMPLSDHDALAVRFAWESGAGSP